MGYVADQNFIQTLCNCCEQFDIYDHVNEGGCFWLASEIAKICEKNDIPFETVLYKEDDYETADGTLLEGEYQHCSLKIDGVEINPSYDGSLHKEVKHLSSKQLKKLDLLYGDDKSLMWHPDISKKKIKKQLHSMFKY